ncbi:MAG: SDR family NAD(P)-dependent oxidoreductase [Cucumibacter sp.]
MNQIDLQGQAAVVTGGARGIGLAIAARLHRSGAKVALWDRDSAGLEVAVAGLGSGAHPESVDVTDYGQVEAAVETSEAAIGPISMLVNSAGVAGLNADLDRYPLEEWGRVIAVNLTGTFHVNRALVPGMKARNYGRIVNIASIAGKEGNPTASAYSASKAGVIALTKSLGKELAKYDIAVNCITPSAANTRMLEDVTPEFIAYMLARIPRGRFVEVEEIAAMVVWLCSKENSFTTAGVFDLSGGRATY